MWLCILSVSDSTTLFRTREAQVALIYAQEAKFPADEEIRSRGILSWSALVLFAERSM